LISVGDLPAANAVLNGASAVLLVCGFSAIRRKNVEVHRGFMVSALVTSTLFLASYLVYHWQVGSVRFGGTGWIRPVYFAVLVTHTVLAAGLLPLVLVTLYFAARRRFDAHRRMARWTLPVWLYVSATGVMIYLLLYQVYGPAG